MCLAYLDRLFAPIENLTGLYSELQQHVASVRRAQRLLDQRSAEGTDNPPVVVGAGAVAFENVTFGYAAKHPVLKGVSFRLRPGERTALVGPSGAGKTTIADLLAGLYAPQAGRILLDDQDIAGVAPWSLRGAVLGVVAAGRRPSRGRPASVSESGGTTSGGSSRSRPASPGWASDEGAHGVRPQRSGRASPTPNPRGDMAWRACERWRIAVASRDSSQSRQRAAKGRARRRASATSSPHSSQRP